VAVEALQGHFSGKKLDMFVFCRLSGGGDSPGALQWQHVGIESFLPLKCPGTLPLHPFRRFDTIDLHWVSMNLQAK
jgi:hypothetical protein